MCQLNTEPMKSQVSADLISTWYTEQIFGKYWKVSVLESRFSMFSYFWYGLSTDYLIVTDDSETLLPKEP